MALSRAANRVGIAVALCLVAAQAAAIQRTDDRSWYKQFVDGVAGTVYAIAWPTATYRSVDLKDVSLLRDGATVVFRLHGNSAFASGDLWVDVLLQIQSGKITDITWGDYNGFFPPGFSWQTAGAIVEELNKDSSAKRTPAPPATSAAAYSALCLSNPTQRDVSYSIKWGTKTASYTLTPGQSWRFWAPESTPRFEVSFDGDLTPAIETRTLSVTGATLRGEPATCTENLTLDFVVEQQRLGINPRLWIPKFPHPFTPNLVAGTTKDLWTCADGFKWATPDPKSNECIEQNVGLVGLTMVAQSPSTFPQVGSVVAGGAADQAGITVGTFIITIDGVSTEGLTPNALVPKIRGQLGTTVRLGIVTTGSAPRVVVLTRR